MLPGERESASEILLLPLKTTRRTPRIGKVASGVAVGKNRERFSPLPKHVELKSLVGEQRREEGLIVKDGLLRNQEEFAFLLGVRRRLLGIEGVQSDEALLLRKKRAGKLQTVPAVQC